MELIRERAVFAKDLWELSDYFFVAPDKYDQTVKEKFWKEDSGTVMKEVVSLLESLDEFSKTEIELKLPALIKERGWQMGSVMNLLRLFMVGESKGPAVAHIMELIGRDETISRIKKGVDF